VGGDGNRAVATTTRRVGPAMTRSPAGRARRKWPDMLGLAWTVVAALCTLAPALRPGVALGSFDLL